MATELFDLSARIAVDVGQSEKALTDTQKKVLDLANEFKNIDKASASAGSTAKVAADKQARSASSAGVAVKDLTTEVKKSADAIESQAKGADRAAEGLRELAQQGGKAAQSAQNVSNSVKKSAGNVGDLGNAIGILSPRLGGTVNNIEQLGASLGTTMGTVGLAVGAVAALGAATVAAGAGMFYLAKNAADEFDKFNDISAQVNFSVQTLSALDAAASTSGTTIEALSAALGIFDKNLESAAQGNEKMSRLFKALNIDVNDNEQALTEMFKVLSEIPPGAQQTALAMAAFGRSGKDVLGVIKATDGDLPAFMQKMRDLGILLEDEDAQAANGFADNMALLSKQFDHAKAKVGVELMPVFTDLFTKLSGWISTNKGELRSWGQAFADMAATAISAASGIASAFSAINGIAPKGEGRFKDETPGGLLGLNRPGSYYNQFVNYIGGLFDSTDHAALNSALGRVDMNAVPNQTSSQIAATAAANLQAQNNAMAEAAKRQAEAARLAALIGGDSGRGGGSRKQTAEDYGLQLLGQLDEQIKLLTATTKQDTIAVELQKEQYRGLNEVTKQAIQLKAADLQAGMERKEAREREKQFTEELTKAFLSHVEGEQSWVSKTRDMIVSTELKGIAVDKFKQGMTLLRASVLDSVAALEKLNKTKIALPDVLSGGANMGLPTPEELMKRALEADIEPPENFMKKRLEELQQYKDALMDVKQGFVFAMMDGFSRINEGFGSMAKNMLLSFADMLTQMVIQAQMARLAEAIFGSGQGGGSGFWSGLFKTILNIGAGAATGGAATGGGGGLTLGHEAIHFRASGGPVMSMKPYMVGERGPELFVPGNSGSIVPNNQLQGIGGGNTYHFHINGVKNPQDFMSRETQYQMKQQARKTLESMR